MLFLRPASSSVAMPLPHRQPSRLRASSNWSSRYWPNGPSARCNWPTTLLPTGCYWWRKEAAGDEDEAVEPDEEGAGEEGAGGEGAGGEGEDETAEEDAAFRLNSASSGLEDEENGPADTTWHAWL